MLAKAQKANWLIFLIIASSFVFSSQTVGVADNQNDSESIIKAKIETGEALTAYEKAVAEELELIETPINPATPRTYTNNRTTYLSEGFEVWPPAGWGFSPGSGTGAWLQDNGTDHGPGSVYEGTYAAMFNNYDYSSGTEGSMFSPTLDLSAATTPLLKFYWWNNDGSYNPAKLYIATSTDGSTYTPIDTILTYGSGATTWVAYSQAIGADVVAFKITAVSDWGMKNTFIDQLTVEDAPTDPVMAVSSDSLGFGVVPPGYVANQTLTISNSGGADLVISSIATTSTNFGVDVTSGTVTPSGTLDIGVTFSYTTGRTDYLGDLIITSNNPTSPDTVKLGGSSLDAPTTGGPDAFGYSWANSYDAAGPTYGWIDTTGAINSGIAGGDDWRGTISVPFDFYFYGNWYSEITATTNGWIGMGPHTGYSSSYWTNYTIPYSSNPNNIIAPLWDDWKAGGTTYPLGAIYYKTVGTAPNRQFVVIFHNFYRSSSNTDLYSFECILDEATNNIILQYADVVGSSSTANNGVGATVGIENAAGDDGLLFEFNGVPQLVYDGEAIEFIAPAPLVPTLLFSEYIEGSSNNKALEIFNATLETISLDDYQIGQTSNGSTAGHWEYFHIFPTGTSLAPGEVWTIVNDAADASMQAVADELLAYPSVVHHNGDDARSILKIVGTDTTVIDLIGETGPDPGNGWAVAGVADATKDHTLIRKAAIVEGNADWAASAGTDADDSEWIVLPQDHMNLLGFHPHTDIYEHNNTLSTAAAMAIGDTLDFMLSIDPVDDVDWFVFAADAGAVITIDLFANGYSSLDGEIALFDADSVKLASADNGYSGGDEQIPLFTIPATGNYYILCGYYGDVRATTGAYALGLGLDVPDPGETCETAIAAAAGDNSATGQPIWYEYTATVTGTMTISSCITGQSVDTKLYVYDACGGTQVAYSDDAYCSAYNYASEASFSCVSGTTYKIYWDDYWSSASFVFNITEAVGVPDLTISDVVFDPATKTLAYNWNNIGDGDAGFHYSSVWINNTNWPIHCGAPYGDVEFSITSLAANTSVPVVVDLTDLAIGDYEVYVTVDNDCYIDESDETNNETGPVLFTILAPNTPTDLVAVPGIEEVGLTWVAAPTATARLAGPETAALSNLETRLGEGSSSLIQASNPRQKQQSSSELKEQMDMGYSIKSGGQYSNRDGAPTCDSALVAIAGVNHSDHTGGVEQWFYYTATADGQITVSACDYTTEDTYVKVYASCADWAPTYPYGTPIASDDDACGWYAGSEVTFACTAGETYYIWWRNVWGPAPYDWSLTEAAGAPDLLANSIWYDETTDALKIEIINIGELGAGGFYVDWYLTNPTPDSCGDYGEGYNAYTYSSSLAAGDTVVHSVTGVQAFMGFGTFTMGAYVDDDCTVDESNEGNNVINSDFTFLNPLEGVVWNIYRDGTFLDTTSSHPNYLDEAVTGGTEYCYTVTQMLDDTTETGFSNQACATPIAAGLCSVQDLSAMGGVNFVELTWSEPFMPLSFDFTIDAIPFDHVWNNIGATDDYDVTYSDGADIAYSFTTTETVSLDITLCDSVTDYDTKLEVFTANGTSLAYDDDGPYGSCPESSAPYAPSELLAVVLDPGTYYIVVDGYSGAEGNYGIHITTATGGRNVATAETWNHELKKGLRAGYTVNQVEDMSRDVDPLCGEHLGYSVQDATGTELLFTTEEYALFDSLAPGEYCYQVVAVYDEGNSAPSNLACAVALSPPMPGITIVTPADSSNVGQSVDVSFLVENFIVEEDSGAAVYNQCFEFCDDMPWDLTINMLIDNNSGGWFRDSDGTDAGCGTGFNSCGADTDGTSAVAVWSTPGVAVDSRMITPSVTLPAGPNVLKWWTAYVYATWATMDNLVEVSADGGTTWDIVYTDDPLATGNVVVERSVDISAYAGQTIMVSFRFQDDSNGEAWFVDDIYIGAGTAAASNPGLPITGIGEKSLEALSHIVFPTIPDNNSRDADGFIKIYLNGTLYGEHHSLAPVTVTGLTDGANQVKLELVDLNGDALVPPAADVVTLFFENAAPGAFNLVSPNDNTTIVITPDNLSMMVMVAWTPAVDPDGDAVGYGLRMNSAELGLISADTTATVYYVSYGAIANTMEAAGVSTASGSWNIFASDGLDTTWAANGPRTLNFDATALGIDDKPGIPDVFALHQNYPNPFNPLTTVRYDIPEASKVQIVIYDLMGRRVKTLVNEFTEPGYHSVIWNGTNEQGAPVASGMYIYRIKAADFVSVKKLLLMK